MWCCVLGALTSELCLKPTTFPNVLNFSKCFQMFQNIQTLIIFWLLQTCQRRPYFQTLEISKCFQINQIFDLWIVPQTIFLNSLNVFKLSKFLTYEFQTCRRRPSSGRSTPPPRPASTILNYFNFLIFPNISKCFSTISKCFNS